MVNCHESSVVVPVAGLARQILRQCASILRPGAAFCGKALQPPVKISRCAAQPTLGQKHCKFSGFFTVARLGNHMRKADRQRQLAHCLARRCQPPGGIDRIKIKQQGSCFSKCG